MPAYKQFFLTQDFLLLWMFNRTKLDIHPSIPTLLQGKEILFSKKLIHLGDTTLSCLSI